MTDSPPTAVVRIGPFSVDLSTLIPAEYAAYAPLVIDGLRFFVEALPPARRHELFIHQQRLPPDADAAHRLVALLQDCPTLHKLGQLLARDRALAPGLRARLQTLESLAPHTPTDDVHAAIRAELGAAAERLALRASLAEGSVAVIVPFDLAASTQPAPAGVLKVLRHGIEARLAEDLNAWSTLSDYLDARQTAYDLTLDHRALFETVSELLTSEIDFRREQRNLSSAANMLRGHARLCVPNLLPFCTPRLTAMEYLPGHKITAAADLASSERRTLADTLAESLIACPALSADVDAVFHGDPHAGNLLRMPDGRAGVVDWSLAARFTALEREHLAQFVLNALLGDVAGVTEALAGLALRTTRPHRLREVVDAHLRVRSGFAGVGFASLFPMGRPLMHGLLALMDAVPAQGIASFGPNLALLRKALFTLEQVLRDVSPECSVDAVLMQAAVRQFAREWPARGLVSPWSRAFGTRLSNMDLLHAGLRAGGQIAAAMAALATPPALAVSPRSAT